MKKVLFMIVASMLLTACSSDKTSGQVTGKNEKNGRHYIEISIEVTPEEYIGTDIGDCYEVGK